MTRARVRTGWSVAVVGVVAVLSACSVAGSDAAPPDASPSSTTAPAPVSKLTETVRQGAAATAAQNFRAHVQLAVPPAGTAPFTADLEVDAAHHRSHITLDLGGLPAAFGQADLDGHAEIVTSSSRAYVRSKDLERLAGMSTPWGSIRTSFLGRVGLGALDGSVLGQGRSALDALQAAGTVSTVGPETVRGVPTTHVTVTVDADRIAAKAPKGARASITETVAALAGGPGRALHIDAWLDAQHLVRRIHLAVDLSGLIKSSEAFPAGSTDITVELYGIGEPVTVTVPKASEVSPLRLPGN